MSMAKKDKKKDDKSTEVKVQDKTKDGDNGGSTEVAVTDTAGQSVARSALDALSDEQKADLLKDMGFTKRKAREKKDKGPDPKQLFTEATERLFNKMPEIKGILDGCDFPASVAVTVGLDPEGLFFADLKRVRKKYGKRKGKD
jgi:hypothetical protein